jgi:hypothetical protein
LFESKEVIEEAQRVPAKAASPVETPDVSDATEEQQIPKATAPTPEQIIAIKVQ